MINRNQPFTATVIILVGDYVVDTWGLDGEHSMRVLQELVLIFEECYKEYSFQPNFINKGKRKKLIAALKHIRKANVYLADVSDVEIDIDKSPFVDILPEHYREVKFPQLSLHDDKLHKIHITSERLDDELTDWLLNNRPSDASRANHRRKIIIKHLYALYQELTGKVHVDKNHPEEIGDRVHTPFSKVAILMDRLAGNPHKDTATIPVWKNDLLNIDEIVHCGDKPISSFCKDIKQHIL